MTGGRTFISFSLGHGIRVGRSVADPRLPQWRRFELRRTLQEAAKARGESLTKEEAGYIVDKSYALGIRDLSHLDTMTRDEMISCMMTIEPAPDRHWPAILAIVAVTIASALAFITERG